MSSFDDYKLALELQKQFDAESNNEANSGFKDSKKPLQIAKQKPVKRSNPHSNLDEEFLNRTQNLVHPMWETLDPTPDVNALFLNFDDKFFQSRLRCVTLEWSKRMYSCAGICYLRSNRFGKDITIRLSEPLLKLRPRKDLIETLLHEMIHAYCFVLNIREGNGGHGPVFKKVMVSINKVAGTNITVYHSFHDEVNLYKQHWWRCNGSCQNRAPFFGFVKRTSNRAPSANDQWWALHQESCGGTFLKIKEPEKREKSRKIPKPNNSAGDIRKFIKTPTSTVTSGGSSGPKCFGNTDAPKGPLKANGGGTILLNPKNKTATSTTSSIAKAFPPSSYPGLSNDPFSISSGVASSTPAAFSAGGNLRNVVGFRDLNGGVGSLNNARQKTSNTFDSGRGFTLSDPSGSGSQAKSPSSSSSSKADREHLRAIWSKRFTIDDKPSPEDGSKRPRLVEPPQASNDKAVKNAWEVLDDDVMVKDTCDEIIALSSDEEDNAAGDGFSWVEEKPSTSDLCKINSAKGLTAEERRNTIRREILEESLTLTDDAEIVLIDDEYDDNNAVNDLTIASELADTSMIDEFFGEDTLLKDFLLENDIRPTFSSHVPNPADDIITCPICQNKMKRSVLEEHLDGCTGIAVKILAPKHALKKIASSQENKTTLKRPKPSKRQSAKEVLRNAGYTEEDLASICLNSSTENEAEMLNSTTYASPTNTSPCDLTSPEDTVRTERQRSIYKTTRQCPICAQEVEEDEINEHLDDCLMQKRRYS